MSSFSSLLLSAVLLVAVGSSAAATTFSSTQITYFEPAANAASSTLHAGSNQGLQIDFTHSTATAIGDTILVYLPNYVNPTAAPTVYRGAAKTTTDCEWTAAWDAATFKLTLTRAQIALAASTAVSVFVTGFTLPIYAEPAQATGGNVKSGNKKIAYKTEAAVPIITIGSTAVPSALTSTTLAYRTQADNIALATGGNSAAPNIALYFTFTTGSTGLKKGDRIEWYLPGFVQTTTSPATSGTGGTITWDNTNKKLLAVLTADIAATTASGNWIVKGFTLPTVTANTVPAVTLSLNGATAVSLGTAAPTVYTFSTSAPTISWPDAGTPAGGTAVALSVTFTSTASALKIGDQLTITLPNWNHYATAMTLTDATNWVCSVAMASTSLTAASTTITCYRKTDLAAGTTGGGFKTGATFYTPDAAVSSNTGMTYQWNSLTAATPTISGTTTAGAATPTFSAAPSIKWEGLTTSGQNHDGGWTLTAATTINFTPVTTNMGANAEVHCLLHGFTGTAGTLTGTSGYTLTWNGVYLTIKVTGGLNAATASGDVIFAQGLTAPATAVAANAIYCRREGQVLTTIATSHFQIVARGTPQTLSTSGMKDLAWTTTANGNDFDIAGKSGTTYAVRFNFRSDAILYRSSTITWLVPYLTGTTLTAVTTSDGTYSVLTCAGTNSGTATATVTCTVASGQTVTASTDHSFQVKNAGVAFPARHVAASTSGYTVAFNGGTTKALTFNELKGYTFTNSSTVTYVNGLHSGQTSATVSFAFTSPAPITCGMRIELTLPSFTAGTSLAATDGTNALGVTFASNVATVVFPAVAAKAAAATTTIQVSGLVTPAAAVAQQAYAASSSVYKYLVKDAAATTTLQASTGWFAEAITLPALATVNNIASTSFGMRFKDSAGTAIATASATPTVDRGAVNMQLEITFRTSVSMFKGDYLTLTLPGYTSAGITAITDWSITWTGSGTSSATVVLTRTGATLDTTGAAGTVLTLQGAFTIPTSTSASCTLKVNTQATLQTDVVTPAIPAFATSPAPAVRWGTTVAGATAVTVTFSFTPSVQLQVGSVVYLLLPGWSAYIAPTITESNWTPTWDATNQKMKFVRTSSASGTSALTLTISNLVSPDVAVTANSGQSYQINADTIVTIGASDAVTVSAASTLLATSLSYGGVTGLGASATLTFCFTTSASLAANSYIYVEYAGLTHAGTSATIGFDPAQSGTATTLTNVAYTNPWFKFMVTTTAIAIGQVVTITMGTTSTLPTTALAANAATLKIRAGVEKAAAIASSPALGTTLSAATLTFGTTAVNYGMTGVTVTLGFTSSAGLAVDDYVELTVTGWTVSSAATATTGYAVDGTSANKIKVIKTATALAAAGTASVVVTGLTLPETAFAANSATLKHATSSQTVTVTHVASTAPSYLYNTAITYGPTSATAAAQGQDNTVTFTYYSSICPLQIGDYLSIYLPGFRSFDPAAITVGGTDASWTALWDQSTNVMKLTRTAAATATQTVKTVTFNLVTSDSTGSPAAKYAINSLATGSNSVTVPSITAVTAGTATELSATQIEFKRIVGSTVVNVLNLGASNVDLKFTFQKSTSFAVASKLSMILPGFQNSATAPTFAKAPNAGTDDNWTVVWDQGRTILQLTRTTAAINAATSHNVVLTGFTLPTSAVSSSNLKMRVDTQRETNIATIPTSTNAAAAITVSAATITLESGKTTPGATGVALTFAFTFSRVLEYTDTIEIYLPGFTNAATAPVVSGTYSVTAAWTAATEKLVFTRTSTGCAPTATNSGTITAQGFTVPNMVTSFANNKITYKINANAAVAFGTQPSLAKGCGAQSSWLTATVGQTVTQPCRPNTITFTLKPAIPLAPLSRIVLNGLVGTKTSDMTQFLPKPVGAAGASIDTTFSTVNTSWVQNTGTLTMYVASTATITSTADTVIAVELINPHLTGAVVPTAKAIASPLWATSIPATPVMGSVMGAQASWTATIHESVTTTNVDNTITMTIAPSQALAGGAKITVAGLTGTQTADNTALAVTGTDSAKVGATADWKKTTGTLTFTLNTGCSIAAAGNTVLSVVLKNPTAKQAAVKGSVTSADAPMFGVMGYFTTSVIGAGGGYWQTTTVHESSQTTGATNTITLTLKPSVALASADKITVAGLLNSQTADNAALTVSGSQASSFGATGDWTKNTGTLILTASGTLAATTDIVVSVALQNPAAGTTAVAGTVDCAGVITKGTLSTAVLGATFTWTSVGVGESSVTTAGSNTLTFTIQPSTPVPIGTVITIKGISDGTTTADANTCASGTSAKQLQVSSAIFGMTGAWTMSTGTLLLTTATVLPSTATTFTTVLKNLAAERALGAYSPTISTAAPQLSTQKIFTDCAMGAGGACWLVSKIGESSYVNDAANTITVTIQPSRGLASGATVTLTGLVNSQTADGNIAVTGTNFVSTAAWTQTSGQIVLTTSAAIATTAASVITFSLKNPATGKSAAVPTISAMTATPKTAAKTFTGSVLGGTNTWSTATIAESSRTNGGANTITCTFKPSGAIPSGHMITISGLAGSQTDDNTALAVAGAASASFGSSGAWTKNTGTLVLTTSSSIVSTSDSVITFSLKNPAVGVKYVTANIFSDAPAYVTKLSFTGNVLGGTSAWTSATISEASTAVNGDNAITLAFAPSQELIATQKVTVTGLSGSATATSATLAVTGTNAADFGSTGNWNSDGTLILTIAAAKKVATSGATIIVTLKNPAAATTGKTATIKVDAGPQDMAAKAMTGSVLGAGGGVWTTASIHESTQAGGMTNTLTITLKPTVVVAATKVLTIAGLTGTTTATSATLAVAGTDKAIFGSTGDWNKDTGTLKLTVATGQSMAANTDVAISIAVVNPCAAQAPKAATIATTDPVITTGTFNKVLGGSSSWTTTTVAESTKTTNVDNTLTFTLKPAVSLESGHTITIGNLQGTQTADSTTSAPFQITDAAGKFGATGAWTQSTGQMVLTLASAMDTSTNIVIAFNLKNSASKVEARYPSIMSASPGYIPTKWFTTAILGDGGYWITATLTESSATTNAANTLTLTLQPSVALASGQAITIKGLTGTQTTDLGTGETFAITGTDAAKVGSTGAWTQSTGTLVLTTTASIPTGANSVFSFVLKNKASAQAQVMPTLSSSTATTMTTKVLGGVLGNTYTWTTSSVGESSTTADAASNVVTFTVKPSVDLAAGQTFTITGLTGSQTADQSSCPFLAVTGTDSASFGQSASWTQNTGQLVLTTAKAIGSSADTVFAITLKNKAAAQAAVFPTISANAVGGANAVVAATPFPEAVLGAGGGYWKSLVVTESAQGTGAANTLTIKFQPTVALAGASVITISGLTGSSQATASSHTVAGASEIRTTADWNKDTGTLKLTAMSGTIAAATTLTITTAITNPAAGQVPVTPTITATNMATQTFVGSLVLGSTSTWSTKSSSESSAINGGLNTLTFSLVASSTLGVGRLITISSLGGSTTPTNKKLPLAGTNAAAFGSTGDWTMAGTLVLTVATAITASSTFSITLVNPSAARTAVAPSISASAPQVVTQAAMSTAVLGGTGTWTVASVAESSQTTDAENTLTFTLHPNPALAAGQVITLGGIKNTQTATKTDLVVNGASGTPMTTFNGVGNWDATAQTLKLTIKAGESMTGATIFKVTLKNAKTAQGAAVISAVTGSPQTIKSAIVSGSVLGAGGGVWTTKTITESSQVNNGMNTLTITFKPSVSLAKETLITIKGLTGTQSTDSADFKIAGANAALFGVNNGTWTQSSGQLILRAVSTVGFSTATVITAVVKNPAAGQTAVLPTILVSSTTNPVTEESFDKKILGGTSVWTTATVFESKITTGVENTITFTIKPATAIAAGHKLTIGGLKSSTTADNTALAVSGTSSATFGSTGAWTMVAGELVLTTATSVSSTANTVFSIHLGNKAAAQAAVIPMITSAVPQMFRMKAFDKGVLGAGGGYWLINYVAESSQKNTAANTLTFTLKPSVALAEKSLVTISGLTGTRTADKTDLAVTGAGSALFGSKGAWTQNTGSLVLTVAASQTIPTSADTVFSMVVENPALPQTAVVPMVQASVTPTTAMKMHHGPILGGTGMFAEAEVMEKGITPSAASRIDFVIKPAVPFMGGAKITISGLKNSATADNTAFAVMGPEAVAFWMTGDWKQTSGILTLTVAHGQTIPADKPTKFWIHLTNPAAAQVAQIPTISAGPPQTTMMKIFKGGVLGAGGGFFMRRHVKESTIENNMNNTLTFDFTPSVALGVSKTVTIKGLTNALDGTGSKVIGGRNGDIFGMTGAYTQGGTLVLTVATNKTMMANKTVSITVKLQNPASAKPGVTPSISGDLMAEQPFMQTVLSGTARFNATIQESAPGFVNADKMNTITFIVTPTVTINGGTRIGIGGLLGSQTPDNKALLLMGPAAVKFGNTANWMMKDGKLGLMVAMDQQLLANTELVFSVTLKNPSLGHDGVVPMINAPGFKMEPFTKKVLLVGGKTTAATLPKTTAPPLTTLPPFPTPKPCGANATNCTTPPPPPSCSAKVSPSLSPVSLKVGATGNFNLKFADATNMCTKASVVHFGMPTKSNGTMVGIPFKTGSKAGDALFDFKTDVPGTYTVRLNCGGFGIPECAVKVVVSAPSAPIVMTFPLDIKDFAPGSANRKTFEDDFASGVSTSLGVPKDSVCCITMTAGSVKVGFQLLASETKDVATLESTAKTTTVAIAKAIQTKTATANYPGAGVAPSAIEVDGQKVADYVAPPKLVVTTQPSGTSTGGSGSGTGGGTPAPASGSITNAPAVVLTLVMLVLVKLFL